jgi:hypothetical protein
MRIPVIVTLQLRGHETDSSRLLDLLSLTIWRLLLCASEGELLVTFVRHRLSDSKGAARGHYQS